MLAIQVKTGLFFLPATLNWRAVDFGRKFATNIGTKENSDLRRSHIGSLMANGIKLLCPLAPLIYCFTWTATGKLYYRSAEQVPSDVILIAS